MSDDKNIELAIKEITKLYNLDSDEIFLLTQMSLWIGMLGYSPKLRVKLVKTLAAIDELILDEMKNANQL